MLAPIIMRRAFCLLLLASLWAHPIAASNSAREFEEDLAAIRALGPRPEGSEAERKLVALIRNRLTRMGVSFEVLDFSDFEGAHSFDLSVVATIHGERADSLLLCIPLDSSDADSAASALGPALGLEIARRAAGARPALTLRILFLGAEEGPGASYPMGSRRFLASYALEHRAAVLYLRLARGEKGLRVRAGSDGQVAPLWMLETALECLRRAGLESSADGEEIQLVRSGLAGLRTPIGPYLQEGYPALLLEGGPSESAPEALDRFGAAFADFTDIFLDAAARRIESPWDRHYLLFRLGTRYLFVSERSYLVGLLLLLAASLAYGRLAGRRLGQDVAAARTHVWLLPLLFSLAFASLAAATEVLAAVQGLRGVADLWSAAPALFLALKAASAVSLLLLSGRMLLRLAPSLFAAIPARFFPGSALLLVVLGLVVVGAADISLTAHFLWPLAFVLLYDASRSLWLRLAAAGLAPASLAASGLDLVLRPGSGVAPILLLAPLRGNLVLALLALPYVLLLLDLTLARSRPPGLGRALTLSAGGLAALLAAAALLVPAYGPERPQVIEATVHVDLDSRVSYLRLASSGPLGSIVYSGVEPGGGTPLAFSTRARVRVLPAETPQDLLRVELTRVAVLDRRNVSVRIEPRGPADRVELVLYGADPFLLIDANCPATAASDGRSYTLHVGRRPPVPLELDLTLPEGMAFALAIRLYYEGIPTGVTAQGPHRIVRHRMIVDSRVEFGT